MHDRYLQHVFRWTTKAGSFECSSFVRLKPAAPSKSMAVWGIIFVVLLLRVSGGERAAACYLTALAATRGAALPGLGLWVTADPRLCVARARSGESFAARRVRNERCATYYKPGVQDGGGDSARALSIFFGALGLSAPSTSAPVEDRKRSRGVPWTAPPKIGSQAAPNTRVFSAHGPNFAGL